MSMWLKDNRRNETTDAYLRALHKKMPDVNMVTKMPDYSDEPWYASVDRGAQNDSILALRGQKPWVESNSKTIYRLRTNGGEFNFVDRGLVTETPRERWEREQKPAPLAQANLSYPETQVLFGPLYPGVVEAQTQATTLGPISRKIINI